MKARPCRAVLPFLAALSMSGGTWAQAMQLKLASFGPPQAYFLAEIVVPWAEAVSRDSGGTVQITHFGGGVLGNAGNMYDVVTSGAADIGWALQGTVPGKFARSSIIELPFGYDTGEAGAVAFWRLFSKGLIAGDYDEVKLFGVTAWPAAAIQTKSKRVTRLEDLKGMKLRVSGKLQADTVLALGATPVAIAVDELYQSIDKGVIDGAWASLTATRQFRLQEVAKNFLDVSLNGAGAMLIMNKQTFDKLPPQAKAAFEKHSGEALSRALGRSNDGEVVRVHQMLGELAKQKKIEPVYKLSEQELARWRKGVEPIASEWAQRVPNGKAILETFRAEVTSLQKTR
jgi:TRAP-type C4-dicarboxylate transport system substrate-binding protein